MWGKMAASQSRGLRGPRSCSIPRAGQGGCPPPTPPHVHSHPAGQHPEISSQSKSPPPPEHKSQFHSGWDPGRAAASEPVCFIKASSWANRTVKV